MKLNNPKALLLCFAASFAAFGFGGLFVPGEWYAGLNRAPWSPPNIAFPIVWSFLYVLIALAGWKVFCSNNQQLKTLWLAQLALNAIWSWVFFGQHWIVTGLVDIVLIVLLVGLIIVGALKLPSTNDGRWIAGLMTPYLMWLALATSLNAYIALMN